MSIAGRHAAELDVGLVDQERGLAAGRDIAVEQKIGAQQTIIGQGTRVETDLSARLE